MLLANVSWGLMSPIAKIVMAGGLVTPLVLSDLRIFGAMILFWIVSLFRKPEHVASRDMFKLFGASLLAIVFNQGCFIFGVGMTSPADASIITTSMPLWAMLLAAFFLREPITAKKVLGIALGAGGRGGGRRRRSRVGRSAGAARAVELCALHRAVQELREPLLAHHDHEVDVHLRLHPVSYTHLTLPTTSRV